uniref:MARVEL domain-containing protein n=1 Tax=Steinernema glaseri TaxID=37863 RepID=A0A1I7YUD4_9BILA
MLSLLTSNLSFLDTAIGFFVIEAIVSLIQVIADVVFTCFFTTNLQDFLSSVDGFISGIDFAVWITNIALVAVSFLYDSVRLPCCLHLIMTGFVVDLIYTARLACGVITWSPQLLAPSRNGGRTYSDLCILYFCVSAVMFACHAVGLIIFGAVAKNYKTGKKRFLGFKEA